MLCTESKQLHGFLFCRPFFRIYSNMIIQIFFSKDSFAISSQRNTELRLDTLSQTSYNLSNTRSGKIIKEAMSLDLREEIINSIHIIPGTGSLKFLE